MTQRQRTARIAELERAIARVEVLENKLPRDNDARGDINTGKAWLLTALRSLERG